MIGRKIDPRFAWSTEHWDGYTHCYPVNDKLKHMLSRDCNCAPDTNYHHSFGEDEGATRVIRQVFVFHHGMEPE